MRLPRLEKAYPSWRVLMKCWVDLPFQTTQSVEHNETADVTGRR